MRRFLLAVLLAAAGAPAFAQVTHADLAGARELRATTAQIDRLARWLKAVDAHEPGEDDEAIETVSSWTYPELQELWVHVDVLARVMRDVRATRFFTKREGGSPTEVVFGAVQLHRLRALACAAIGATDPRVTTAATAVDRDCEALVHPNDLDAELLEVSRHAAADRIAQHEDNYVLRRAALLHADAAMMRGNKTALTDSAQAVAGPQRIRVQTDDGRGLGVRLSGVHWEIAQRALDGIIVAGATKPTPERDDMVRRWYVATAAWMQLHEDHDTRHLDRGRALFPADPDLLFLSGTQHETYGGAAIQNALRSTVMPAGFTMDIASSRGEWRKAETFLRAALAARPEFTEARLRLGRVLGLLGEHADAASNLRQAVPAVADEELRYAGELFLGAEEEALGRFDAARDAYERAAALYPGAQSPLLALGHLARRRGDRAGALAAIDRLFALPPVDTVERTDPLWQYRRAQARNAEELLDAVRDPFRR